MLKLCVLFFLISGTIWSQDIVTAERYLDMVAQRYGSIRDYEARIAIRSGTTDMTGTLLNLSPSFLRIDFTRPSGQVIVFNGDQLTIYLPEYRAVLIQAVTESSQNTSAGIASAQGLTMLKRNYTPAYVSSPDPQPLETGSRELVVQLHLTRRTTSEGFRELTLSIEPETKLIRRIEGRTITNAIVRFDFTSIKINQGTPEQRFIYDPPTSANLYNNFIFRDSD
ncbi:membrane protein [Spirochaetia bacterium]|nr:membrane protein [Spirochaetia bacterium]